MTKRIEQVNLLIKEELSKIILKEIEFPPEVLVTITRVDTAANLIESKIFISVLPETKLKYVMGLLRNNIFTMQQILNKKLVMRPIPKIIFTGDSTIKEAARVEELLEQLKKEGKRSKR